MPHWFLICAMFSLGPWFRFVLLSPARLAMPKDTASSSSVKRKHAVVEGHFDTDSDEELDLDDGMLVDGHGRARKTHTVHVSQLKRKRANSLPGSLLKPTREEPPVNNSLPKEKRKQARNVFIALSFHNFDHCRWHRGCP
jgi:hypothetical protein